MSHSRWLRFGITALLGVFVLVARARDAAAYPQFQFSSGTNRCGQCHYSPSGGGLLTSWGRDESADTISLGGDGAFLHGLLTPPAWLGVGGDFRYAALQNDVGNPGGPEDVAFPMQLDLYGRVALGESWSFNATVGIRGIVRPEDPSVGGRLSGIADQLMSREHYLMWRPSATGPYARIGRFFAPYGLRFVEHVYFVRRYTGFNLYEETYNASAGYVADEWEVHATLFAPVPQAAPEFFGGVAPQQYGFTGYAEKRIQKMSAVAAQLRIAVGSLQSTYQLGGVGKLWLEKAKVLFLGEGDLIRQEYAANPTFGQNQFVSYLGANVYPMRGLMASIAYERFQEDLHVAATGRNAYDVQVNFFPWAHCEIILLGRYQLTGGGATDGGTASLGMLQLHYYL
jgi:hypothetical protein